MTSSLRREGARRRVGPATSAAPGTAGAAAIRRTAVVALGGNALTGSGQTGTWEEMAANADAMADAICTTLAGGWRIAVVHGNGPQVGNLAIQQEEAVGTVPAQPLHLLTAMTQGALGSLLVRALDTRLGPGSAVALVTHVLVERHDPAFMHPTKPIGPFFPPDVARALAAERGWQVAADAGRGHRRVTPSPHPRDVVELSAIRTLLDAGHVVVCAGGGGIPVIAHDQRAPGPLDGVEAVIDKDTVAATVAIELQAQRLLLVTGVDAVRLDFGTARERVVSRLDSDEAQRHLDAGQFPDGSMGPKVAAALRFLRAGGEVAAITCAPLLAATLARKPGAGTRIVPARARIGTAG